MGHHSWHYHLATPLLPKWRGRVSEARFPPSLPVMAVQQRNMRSARRIFPYQIASELSPYRDTIESFNFNELRHVAKELCPH